MIKKVATAAALSALLVGGLAGYAYSEVQSHDAAVRANLGAKRLMVQHQDGAQSFTSTTFTQLTADTITVPASGNYRAVVRFAGESNCSAASWCSATISVDNVQANPKSGSDFAFDSPGGNLWTSNAMERVSDVIVGTGAARNVVVEVSVAVIGGGSWGLDDWTVVTELWKA